MSIEFVITSLTQLVVFAFLFGRQTEAIKILQANDRKHEDNDEKLTGAINNLSKVVERHIGEHEGAKA